MPAMPMNDAALRYSPEIADAFHPTLTLRPATKKSLAVLDRRAAQKPIQIVTITVMALNVRMYGSMFMSRKGEKVKRRKGAWRFYLPIALGRIHTPGLFCIFTSLPMIRS